MRVKLRDIYETKFFYKTFVADLSYLFDSVSALRRNPSEQRHSINPKMAEIFDAAKNGAPIEIDLAGCRVTPDAVSAIMIGFSKGISFCDTADASRDALLMENKNRLAINKSPYLELPVYNIGSRVSDYVKALDNSITYKLPLSEHNIYFPLATIIQCCRPSVQIAPCGLENAYFKFVGYYFAPSDLDEYNEFFYVTKEGVRIVRLNAQRQLYDQKLGLVSIMDALTVGALIPSIFGREKTLRKPGFDILFDRCLDTLQAQGSTQKLTLEQFFSQEV